MTKQQYRVARALITNPAHWTQRADARTVEGLSVHPSDPRAVCYCGIGACERIAAGNTLRELKYVADQIYGLSIVDVNDTIGHTAVLRMFDRAIELAHEED